MSRPPRRRKWRKHDWVMHRLMIGAWLRIVERVPSPLLTVYIRRSGGGGLSMGFISTFPQSISCLLGLYVPLSARLLINIITSTARINATTHAATIPTIRPTDGLLVVASGSRAFRVSHNMPVNSAVHAQEKFPCGSIGMHVALFSQGESLQGFVMSHCLPIQSSVQVQLKPELVDLQEP